MNVDFRSSLRSAWAELARVTSQSREFRTKRLSATVPVSAYAGMRAIDDAPCVLIEGSVNQQMMFELGGMRLGAYRGDGAPLLALTLEDRHQAELFLAVCADVLTVAASGAADGYLTRFLGRLDAWRSFLREQRPGLGKSETVGLIGELLVLERLLKINRNILSGWAAPDDGLHDFLLRGRALEAKAALGVTTRLQISTLDQLDRSGLNSLTLVHIRLVERPSGRCLRVLIEDINSLLGDESSRHSFSNALLKRGLMPDDNSALENPRFEEHEVTALAVSEGFPRLVRAGVPAAVVEAQYSLDLRAVAAFVTDLSATLNNFAASLS